MFKKLIKASVNSSFYLLVILFCSILSFRGVTQNLDLIIYDSLLNKFPKKNKEESKTIVVGITEKDIEKYGCLLYTSPSPRDRQKSRMPSSA